MIEGAAEGAGLGHQFLRHLARTRLLLHLVDLAPFDPDADPVREAKAIVKELRKYDDGLYRKPRWLVLNKADLLPAPEREPRGQAVSDALRAGKARALSISALTGEGCRELVYAIMDYLQDSARKDSGAGSAGFRKTKTQASHGRGRILNPES